MSNFRVGQKVVCVDDARRDFSRDWDAKIREGEIYTIRSLGEFPWAADRGAGLAVRLREIHREVSAFSPWRDYPYAAARFRPLVTKKENLKQRQEIFNRILTEVNGKVDA